MVVIQGVNEAFTVAGELIALKKMKLSGDPYLCSLLNSPD